MNRRKRTEALVRGRRETSAEMAKEIRNRYKVQIIQNPEEGMVMLALREGARNSLFYIGECLICEARVSINSTIGLGLVKGSDEALAQDLAIIDAACNAELPESKAWESRLEHQFEEVRNSDAEDFRKVLASRVSFDSLDQELMP